MDLKILTVFFDIKARKGQLPVEKYKIKSDLIFETFYKIYSVFIYFPTYSQPARIGHTFVCP